MNSISVLSETHAFTDHEYITSDRESFKIMPISRLSFSPIIVYCFICISQCGCSKDLPYTFALHVLT